MILAAVNECLVYCYRAEGENITARHRVVRERVSLGASKSILNQHHLHSRKRVEDCTENMVSVNRQGIGER